MNINVADYLNWGDVKVNTEYYTAHDDSDDIAFWEVEDAIVARMDADGLEAVIEANRGEWHWINAVKPYAEAWELRKVEQGLKVVSKAKFDWSNEGYEHLKPCHLH